jgi:hypothetical protein
MSDIEFDLDNPQLPPDPLEGLIDRLRLDVTVVYAKKVIAALAELKRDDPGAYVALCARFKKTNPDFSAAVFHPLIAAEVAANSPLIADPADTATLLVRLAESASYFIAEGTDEVYAEFEFDGRIEVAPVQGKLYRHWLRMQYFDARNEAPNNEAVKNAISTREAMAFKAAVVHPVHVRVAHQDGKIYLDRNAPERDVIEIDAAGYRVRSQSPVKFIRLLDRGALPIPLPDGRIEDLKPFINLYVDAKVKGGKRVTDRDFKLAIAAILGGFMPVGEFALALLFGTHGSSKTTTLKRLLALIDPVLRHPSGPVREDREVMIVARNSFVQSNDNTKHLSVERQAAFCRLLSGGNVQGRSLFTDMDTFNISVRRPVFATSTYVVVTEEDLTDRMLLIRMGLSFDDPDNQQLKRKTLTELDAAFEAAWPKLLGCILAAVSIGLRNAAVKPQEDLPRLADLAVWTWQCEPGLGWAPGTILAACKEMIREAAEDLAEFDPVAAATLAFMGDLPEWRGTMTELLIHLTRKIPVRVTKTKDWPINGAVLSRRLRALSTVLHRNGLVLRWGHDTDGNRIFRIARAGSLNGEDADPAAEADPEVIPEDTSKGLRL